MFDTERFKTRLREAVVWEATNQGFTQYEIGIVDFLQLRALENASILTERELRKSAAMQRGLSDALSSAKDLIVLAATFATAEKRTILKVSDVEAALKVKHSRAWPFSRT